MSATTFFRESTLIRHPVASRPSNSGATLGRSTARSGLIERLADWADKHPAKYHRMGSWEQYCQVGRTPY